MVVVWVEIYARNNVHCLVVIAEANAEDVDYLVWSHEASVVTLYGFMGRLRLRVVLEPICLFLFDKGFSDSKYDSDAW